MNDEFITLPVTPKGRQMLGLPPLNQCEPHPTRDHLFAVDACGGDAEIICVLQKVMERFTQSPSYVDIQKVNQSAVAEWFYAKYGKG